MKTERVKRLLRVLVQLQSSQARAIGDLAAAEGVSRRTLFRDLKLLHEIGIKIEYDRQARRFRTTPGAVFPAVSLRREEAISLQLLLQHAHATGILPDDDATRIALAKFSAMLPEPTRNECTRALRFYDFVASPRASTSPVMELMWTFLGAMNNGMKVFIRFQSNETDGEVESVLHPYRLAFLAHRWRIAGHLEARKRTSLVPLGRITQATVLDKQFEIPSTFSLRKFLGNAWSIQREGHVYRVRIVFDPAAADAAEDIQWHSSQRTSYNDDGCLVFEADVDGLNEIASWVLGYGEHARVDSPPELRRMVTRRIRLMSALYQDRKHDWVESE